MATLNEGDVVHLKSGGQEMTCLGECAEGVECMWFDGPTLRMQAFSLQTLELADAPAPATSIS